MRALDPGGQQFDSLAHGANGLPAACVQIGENHGMQGQQAEFLTRDAKGGTAARPNLHDCLMVTKSTEIAAHALRSGGDYGGFDPGTKFAAGGLDGLQSG